LINKLLHIIFLILIAQAVEAKSLKIEVKDKTTQKALIGGSFSITMGVNKTIKLVDNNGILEIKDIQYPVKIRGTYIGYESMIVKLDQSNVIAKDGYDFTTIYFEKSVSNINDLVITGQIVPVMAKQSIYKVNAISTTEINQRAAVSLNDVLNYEMNNFVSNDNLLGSSVNIGGIGGQNVKVLINGIPVTGRENGNLDMGQLNMNNIKRIEMIQGPMSVMYGSNALGGVINLITATPKKKISIDARTYLESIGRYNFSSNIGLKRKNHQLQFSIARNFFAGWTPKDSIDRFQLWKPKEQYTSDIQYNFTFKKLKLNYFGSYLNEKVTNKGEPIINPYEGYAFDEYYRTNRIINSISANIQVNETDQINLTNSYQSYKRTKNRLKKDLVSLNQFETKNVGDQDTSRFHDINLRGTYSSSRLKNLDILLGYEYAHETGISFKLEGQNQTMSELGLFGSALYKLKKMQFQPSIRVSYNNRYKINYTPAFHAKYDINSTTQWRASYARGFRAPTLKEMYLQFVDQNHTIIGNADLKPEIGDHVEMGIDHQKQIKKYNIGYSVNTYYNSIQNLIALAVFNNHGVLRQYENIENYQNWIVNVKGRLGFGGLNLSSGVGMIFVQKSSVTPQHNIFEYTFTSSYFIKKIKTAVNFNYKYNSRQPVITIDQQFLYTSPLHIGNASIQRSFLKKSLNAQIGVKNLFNIQNAGLTGNISTTQNSGHSSSGVMQIFPARSFFLDLTYSF
jgi:outer membrane receptor for ferrienterochelin and colicins